MKRRRPVKSTSKQLEEVMAAIDDLNAAVYRVQEATTLVTAKIIALKAGQSGASDADIANAVNNLNTYIASLNAAAA